ELQDFSHPRVELPERLNGERIPQREHRYPVGVTGEGAHGSRADSLGRAIGRDQLGIGGFRLDQLAHQPVVFRVRDERIVQDVIAIVVWVKLVPQRFRAGPRFLEGHVSSSWGRRPRRLSARQWVSFPPTRKRGPARKRCGTRLTNTTIAITSW